MTGDPAEPRRGLIRWLLGSGFAISLGSFLYPVIRFLNPPTVSEAAVNEVAAGKVEDLRPNSGKIVRFGDNPVLLIRVSQTEWRALSAVCTHLSCIVQYQPERARIWCACHNGVYNLQGQVVSGPPPRPLQPYAVHIREDEVVITQT
ncbi:MAG: ubiquinol-cytochrome c reductase iron-sulfur subunit [Bryobacteraceae bacterium]